MRMIRAAGLTLLLTTCVLGLAAQAQGQPLKSTTIAVPPGDPTPTIDVWDIATLEEFHFFFQHLANLDAAADAAEDADSTFDASSWRTLEQRAVGLTDQQGAVLKEVAFGCNQTLSDHDAEVQAAATTGTEIPVDRRQVVSSAMDELHTQLGDEAYLALASYVHMAFGSEFQVVAEAPGPMPHDSIMSGDGGATGNAVPPIFTIGVGGHVTKLPAPPAPQVMAECYTNLTDDFTRQSYPTGVTSCTLYSSNGFPAVSVPCNSTGQCVDVFTTFPGLTRWTEGIHGVQMFPAQCAPADGPPFVGLNDPLHFCRPPGILEFYQPSGSVFNLGGDPACLPANPYGNCALARTRSNLVTFIDIYPFEATLGQNEQQSFNTNIPAVLGLAGPGSLQGNVYKAPPTLNGPQTASVRACDAFYPLDDCIFATIHLVPFKMAVTPKNIEALPLQKVDFTAEVSPQGRKAAWTVSAPAGAPPGAPVGEITASEDTLTGHYKAPKNEDINFVAEAMVKGCLDPAPSGGAVCDTAQVKVPKIQFFISGAQTNLAPNETLQLTATYQGSSLPRKVKWQIPFAGTLTPVDSTQTLDDTLVVLYKAEASPIGSGTDIKACFQESPDFCATYHVSFLPDSKVTSITPDTGAWYAGTLTSFTILGIGFGSNPAVQFGTMQTVVTLASDTKIQGQVRIPVSAGGTTVRPKVTVTYSNGDTNELTPITISILRANLSVLPSSVDLHAGQSQQFSALCLAPAAPCTSLETPTWSASPGEINQSGKYTAPASVTANGTATVSACWGIGYCGIAHVNLLATTVPVVTVSPKTVSLTPGQTQRFTAQVTGTTNTAVTWSIQPAAGSIDQFGLYTAPAPFGSTTTVTVTATSQADATRNDTATVTLIPAALTLTSTPSPASVNSGTTITWTAFASGGTPGTIQYAFFRRKAETTTWIPSLETPAWQTSNVLVWTPGSADSGLWEIRIGARDVNTPPNAPVLYDPGPVQVLVPLTLTCTSSPASAPYGTTINWTATASGGIPATTQYALFRKKAGNPNPDWIPSVSSPAWQSSNVLSWSPGSDDVGTWEIIIWVRDGNTPANMNGYGFAAYCNPGPVQVTVPVFQSFLPTGWIDGFDQQHIWGWACDPDYPAQSNRVDIYTTSWQYLGSTDASYGSSAAINSACRGGSAHYFDFYHHGSIAPGTHFMVWSIDLPYNTPGNVNRPIGGFGSIGDGTEFVMPVFQSYAPIGWVDGFDRQHIWGWACDPDFPNESNRVDIYTTGWQYLGSADASYGSSAAINSVCNGGWAHYFDFYHYGAIPPGTHFMVWSIDLPYNTPGNVNRPIGGFGSIGGGTEFVLP